MPRGFVTYYGSSQKNVLVCNFATDYNLGSMKKKSNIYIKNEHCFVQQEIAPAYCRLFCLLIYNRQPIPRRRKLNRKRIAQQCFSVHLPENSAHLSSHLIFLMHLLPFKTVVFTCLFHIILKEQTLLFHLILKGNLLPTSGARMRIWVVLGIVKETVIRLSARVHIHEMPKHGLVEKKRSP